MSTTRQHIDQLNLRRFTFEDLDTRFQEMDSRWPAPDARLVIPTTAEMIRNLTLLWHAVEPLLTVVAALPLLRPAWADALRLFLAIIAQLLATNPDAAFKAGKDI